VSAEQPTGLVRAIGRGTLVALVINSIIGSGIFGLPDDIARRVGPAGPLAYLLAALGIGVIMACFAEVASQFTGVGGPYLYAREAFGRFAGVQMGWFAWLVRLTSAAANASLFVTYLGEFWAPATEEWPRAVILALLLGLLATVNVRGVKSGANVSNFFTVAKLLPIAIFVGAGLVMVGGEIRVGASPAPASDWLQAILALMFAYGGFEAALMPMGEAKDPRRDAPFALFAALLAVAAVYILVHLVVMGAITDPAAYDSQAVRERPVAEAARVFLGGGGAALIALGVLISTYGYLAGQFVSATRLTFAFAEQRDFPPIFAAVHPRFRTPYVSILVYTALVLALAVYGSFIWNAILAAVARLFTYGLVCAALVRLRRTQPQAAAFRLPMGELAALVGFAFCVLMILQMGADHAKIVAVVAGIAAANWLWLRVQASRTAE
jgi:amino acid transporter